jgi:hypothetical protein
MYGSISLQEDTEILVMKNESIKNGLLTYEIIDQMRADNKSRNILYNTIKEKIQGFQS